MDAQSGVHNRIRALYQRLLNTEKFRYCADLWIKYIDFQLKFGTEKMARDTFYTSLRSCPGGKVCNNVLQSVWPAILRARKTQGIS